MSLSKRQLRWKTVAQHFERGKEGDDFLTFGLCYAMAKAGRSPFGSQAELRAIGAEFVWGFEYICETNCPEGNELRAQVASLLAAIRDCEMKRLIKAWEKEVGR